MKKLFSLSAGILLICTSFILSSVPVGAGSYDGLDLANAILVNQSTLIESTYTDTDQNGHSQAIALSSLGPMRPTEGSEFILLSTGIAGITPVTTDSLNPGSERGNWFTGGQYSNPRDQATLTLTLQVPNYMHYIYYDVQFFTVEYPDYIGSQYNDKLTITVDSPSQGISTYIIDVNGGDFVLNANDIPESGFDVFATSGNPANIDWLTTTPNPTGADGGATALTGREHPVSPLEIITVTIDIKDVGDNQCDSTAFIDNLRFSGFARTEILARKTVEDINEDQVEPGDTLEYHITISNIGTADQQDNPGYEFDDSIPEYTEFIPNSETSSSGSFTFDSNNNRMVWDGEIPSESSIALSFQVLIDSSLVNGTQISNQGTVNWDSDENGENDATELTDDPALDDGIDVDNDGDTDDDDPTIVIVSSYEPPNILTEDFSDDDINTAAMESFEDVQWFITTNNQDKSIFGTAGYYHYSTPQSFKVKLREITETMYWNYSLGQLNSEIDWWEVWFTCGNWSEASVLELIFKDNDNEQITRLKFEYIQAGDNPTSAYALRMWMKTPDGWIRLNSGHQYGYLLNGWYKIRIEKNGVNKIKYELFQHDIGLVDTVYGDTLEVDLSGLTTIEWHATGDPIANPMFFFDDHKIGLLTIE